jgi:prepilin-type N-terminal cleavage/methylation domain-containing protein
MLACLRQVEKNTGQANLLYYCLRMDERVHPSLLLFLHFPSLMNTAVSQQRKGFTLIELLLVIGIIAILAAIVIVAINPTRQLGNARDAQRRSDVNTILNAVYQYAIDNNGTMPSGIATSATEICVTNAATCTGVDLDVLTGSYLVRIPQDPQSATATGTNYFILRDVNTNRITVSAPGVETPNTTISVTR